MNFRNMKLFILATMMLGVSVLSAATVRWTAGGFAQSGPVSGIAYLVQAADDATVDDISNYLQTNGTSYDGTDYSLVGEYSLSSSTGFADVSLNYSGQLTSGTTYFTLILVGDSFILSDLKTGTLLSGPNGDTLSIAFALMGPNVADWTYGELANGEDPVDPGVPEPTALALLALGVAGVALRRRVA